MNSPYEAMQELLQNDKRYKREAYHFIREALQFAQEHLDLENAEVISDPEISASLPPGQPMPRHVTGQQLCQACRLYARDQYGYLAKMVLANWGVRSTSDFGELVYNLIRIKQMRKSESDRREDFDDVYSFDDAFEPQFDYANRDDD